MPKTKKAALRAEDISLRVSFLDKGGASEPPPDSPSSFRAGGFLPPPYHGIPSRSIGATVLPSSPSAKRGFLPFLLIRLLYKQTLQARKPAFKKALFCGLPGAQLRLPFVFEYNFLGFSV